MFEEKAAMFLYSVSPVHMGAGTAIGAIDNPIQRERHTAHPMIAGSGLKGALRHHWLPQFEDKDLINRIFGPEAAASDHAGAVSFGDAQLVLFPVRCLKRSFVYATCPTALARLQRMLLLAGIKGPESWKIPLLSGNKCWLPTQSQGLLSNGRLVLEAYQFEPLDNLPGGVESWLGDNAIPKGQGFEYFKTKLKQDLVVLSDDRFNHFVRHATVVEPHVRINDESGTADDGGLFYTENLPPETLLVSLVMTSKERYSKKAKGEEILTAENILELVRNGPNDPPKPGFDGQLVQIGGDATTGRGQVVVRLAS